MINRMARASLSRHPAEIGRRGVDRWETTRAQGKLEASVGRSVRPHGRTGVRTRRDGMRSYVDAQLRTGRFTPTLQSAGAYAAIMRRARLQPASRGHSATGADWNVQPARLQARRAEHG